MRKSALIGAMLAAGAMIPAALQIGPHYHGTVGNTGWNPVGRPGRSGVPSARRAARKRAGRAMHKQRVRS